MLKTLIFCYFVQITVCDSGRFFRRAHTNTIVETKHVTSLVPSSCIQVEPTLPPCRNVRYLNFPKLPGFKDEIANIEPKIETTPLGWGEYFGFYNPTVTVTSTDIQITTVENPAVVITFAIKGCRPLKLPMDLNRCPLDTSSISVEEILPTSTVPAPILPTETLVPTTTMTNINPTNIPNTVVEEQQSNALEPSPEKPLTTLDAQPTQALTL